MQWDTVSFTWEWKPNFPWPLSLLPYLMQDGLQGKKETLQKKVKSSSGALATVTSILLNKMKRRFMQECLNQHVTLCQCHCIVPEEPLWQLLELQEEGIYDFVSVNWLSSFMVLLEGRAANQPVHRNTTCSSPAPQCCAPFFWPGHLRGFQPQEPQDGKWNSHAGRSPILFSQYTHRFSAD